MAHSNRNGGPGFFQGASHVNTSNCTLNSVGRDQYNYNSMNNEMVDDAYLDKLPRALRAGYSSRNHSACLQGTREGVLQEIKTWELHKTNESVYWLKGVAGCGKSTVAQTFSERSAASGNLGASFFCSRDYPDRRNLHLIFTTIAYDLAYWRPQFKRALVPIIRSNPNVHCDALPVQLEKLLVRPFKQTGLSATIVVDALDECDDREPVSAFLSALALHVENMPTVKIFITGRPEDRIRSGFELPSLRTKELPLHDVESATVDSDIKTFLKTRLGEVATRRRHSITGQWPSDHDVATILKKTAGLFIIAAVIIRFIDDRHASPQKRLKLIVGLPDSTIYEGKSGIDLVYHQILSASLENADWDDPEFVDQLHLVVGSIVLALKPLPRASLAEILETTPESIWNILTHLHSVLIVPESKTEPIRILHKSFADFIIDNQRCPDGRYFIDATAHHAVLGDRCLKLMRSRLIKNICRLPRYALNDDVNDLPARRERFIGSPLSYVCSYWAKHLQLSPKVGANSSAIHMSLKAFFTHNLLSWLEVLSIEAKFHIAIYSLHNVRSWLTDGLDEGLLDLTDDCERFILRSFDAMEKSAMHIYHSALPWAPESSLTRKLYEHELIGETRLLNAVDTVWDACIRTIPVGTEAEAPVFSPDGALIVAYGEYYVKVFDAMTGTNLVTLNEAEAVACAALSPNNRLLASALLYGNVHVWDVQTGTLFRTLQAPFREVSRCSLAFSPCEAMIATGSRRSCDVRIWNILLGCCNSVFQGHSRGVMDICWTAAGKEVISVSGDGTIRIWDVRQNMCLTICSGFRIPLTVACSTNSFFVASTNGTVEVYDLQSRNIIQTTLLTESLTRTRFSIDGDKILLATKKSGYIWDLSRKTRVWSIDYDGDYATFSPDGTRVASVSGKFLKIWKTTAGHKHHDPSVHLADDSTLDDIYISPDEQLVAYKFSNGTKLVNAMTGLSLFSFDKSDIKSIVFSSNSSFAVCLMHDQAGEQGVQVSSWVDESKAAKRPKPRQVCRWNAHTCTVDQCMKVQDDAFHIALSSNGSHLVSLSPTCIKLFDLESTVCLAHSRFSFQDTAQASFACDGMSISVWNGGKTPVCWDIVGPIHNIHPTVTCTITRAGLRDRLGSNSDDGEPMGHALNKDDEWILDQHGRCLCWIPPAERPQRSWGFRHGNMVIIETKGKKVYTINYPPK